LYRYYRHKVRPVADVGLRMERVLRRALVAEMAYQDEQPSIDARQPVNYLLTLFEMASIVDPLQIGRQLSLDHA
jgi:hypothetical protein